MDDLASLVPEFSLALRSLLVLAKGRKLESLIDALDFLTALRLKERFGWRPDLDIISTYIPKVQSTLKTVSKLSSSGEVVARGEFTYRFPSGTFGREDSRLIARSRLAVQMDQKSILTDLLGVRAIGLLPSPSSGWDLIPLSFVVDWFTDIGSRLRDLEAAGFSFLLPIKVYTHSYKITSPLTEEELALDGLSVGTLFGSESPVAQVFWRDVSRHAPFPRSSYFDFRMPSSLPNWMTGGSLAWQILRHT